MKKTKLITFVALLMLVCAGPANATKVKVGNKDQLLAAINNNDDITLIADLNLSEWSTVQYYLNAFTGSIDGLRPGAGEPNFSGDPYYAIIGLKVPLVTNTENASFSNLIIRKSNSSMDYRDMNGLLACSSINTTFENIVLDNLTLDCSAITEDCWRSGMIVGYADGCTFRQILGQGLSLYTDGTKAGLIAGAARNSTFTDCFIMLGCNIYADGAITANAAYVGGICGYTEGGSFTHCINYGLVGGNDDNLGGITGYSNGTNFTDCVNSGSVCMTSKSNFDNTVKEVSKATGVISATTGVLALHCALVYLYVADTSNVLSIWYPLAYFYWEHFFVNAPYAWGAAAAQNVACGLAVSAASVAVLAVSLAVTIYLSNEPDEVGGITGAMYGGTAKNCTNLGAVSSYDAYTGGIAGYAASSASIVNCLNKGQIFGDEQTGGIVGYIDGTVKSCLDMGSVTANESTCGMIYGEKKDGSTITGNVYIAATGDGDASCRKATLQQIASGGIAEYLNTEGSSTEWRQLIGVDRFPIPMTTCEDIPQVGTNGNLIDGTVSTVDYVGTVAEFKAAVANPYANIVLTADIDFENEYTGFGTDKWPFQGTIDGQGHSLKHVKDTCTYENEPGKNNVGVFHYVKNAHFQNLNVESVNITGSCYAGGLAGKSEYSTYTNVNLTGNSYVGVVGEWVGGLVGCSIQDTFTGCSTAPTCKIFSDGWSSGTDACAGGIAGYAENGTRFVSCTNMADVEGDDDRVGGIVGEAFSVYFSLCTNAGYVHHTKVDGPDDEVGGIAGYALSSVFFRCMNTGVVRGGDALIGGIVGHLDKGGEVAYCVNTSLVDGEDKEVAGLVGRTDGGTIHYSLNLGNISGSEADNASICGVNVGGTVNSNYYCCRQASKYWKLVSGSSPSQISESDWNTFRSTDMIDGTLATAMNTLSGYQYWGTDLAYNAPTPMGPGYRFTRRVDNTWGTVCLPFSVSNDENYRFYTFYYDNGNDVYFQAYSDETVIPANTPMLFKRLSDSKNLVFLSYDNVLAKPEQTTVSNVVKQFDNSYSKWAFKGTTDQTTIQTSYPDANVTAHEYYIAQDKFWEAKSQATVPAYRAWLEYYADSNINLAPMRLNIMESDGTVTTVNPTRMEFYKDSPMYDLWGRPMDSSQKGIGIMNGKKYMIR